MSDDTLKPCPHCGGEVAITEYGEDSEDYTGWMIICSTCDTMMSQDSEMFTKNEYDLIAKWNKRGGEGTRVGGVRTGAGALTVKVVGIYGG